MKSLFSLLCSVALFLGSGLSAVQAAEAASKEKQGALTINIGVGGANEVRNESGVIMEGAEIEGITIINGEVSIDGNKVPRGAGKFRSPKSGKTYLIKWGKGDNVSVSEQ